MVAALGVWGTANAWPDLAVAALMSALFLSSAWQILRQALEEHRSTAAPRADDTEFTSEDVHMPGQ